MQFTLLEIVGIPVVLLAVYNGFSTFIKWYTPFLVVCALAGIWVTYLKRRRGYELNFKVVSNARGMMPITECRRLRPSRSTRFTGSILIRGGARPLMCATPWRSSPSGRPMWAV